MPQNRYIILAVALVAVLALAACGAPSADQGAVAKEATAPGEANPSTVADAHPSQSTPAELPDYEIVTLLPRDAIPAVFDPEFLSVEEANQEYSDNELVLGVEIDGEARAYSVPFLSRREIVNDTVGGRPIAVAW